MRKQGLKNIAVFFLLLMISTTKISTAITTEPLVVIQEELQPSETSFLSKGGVIETQNKEEVESESPEKVVSEKPNQTTRGKFIFGCGVIISTLFFAIGIFEIRRQKKNKEH